MYFHFGCLEEFRRLHFLKKLIKFQIFFDLFIYVSKYICSFVLNKIFRSGQVPFELLPGKKCLVGFALATPAQFLNPALQIRNTFPKYCLLLVYWTCFKWKKVSSGICLLLRTEVLLLFIRLTKPGLSMTFFCSQAKLRR